MNCLELGYLEDAILDLAIPTTVLRPGKGKHNIETGYWEHQSIEEVCIKAVIQNATANDLQQVPEGRHMEETIKIYTLDPLYAKRDQRQPDVILWHNGEFEIHSVTNQNQYGGFYKSIGVKKVQ